MNRDIRFTVQIEDDVLEDVMMDAKGGNAIMRTMEVKLDEEASNPDSSSRKEQIEATKGFRPQLRPAMAELQVFYDNQVHFQSFPVVKERTVIGRTNGDVTVQHDLMISSQHAEICRESIDGVFRWYLRDLNSTNGIFINVDHAKLNDGDEVLLGSYRYRLWKEGEVHLLQMIESGKISGELQLPDEGICVGRDQSELMASFWDERLDAKHAFIQKDRKGFWTIKNLQSTNGVWYRVSKLPLTRKCFFQIGEQRFGFRY